MLGRFFNHIINFFYKQKILFVFLLLALFGIFILGISKIKINESIFSALPNGNSFFKFSKLIEQGGLGNQIVFSLNVSKDDDLDKITTTFMNSIKKYTNTYLKDIVIKRPDIKGKMYNYFYYNFPEFINSDYYQRIEKRIAKDSLRLSLSNSQRSLLAPGGLIFKKFILKDPIYITSDFFSRLNKQNNSSNFDIENGYVFSGAKHQLLITAKTNFKISDHKKDIELYNALNSFKANWNSKKSNCTIDYFDTFQISAENEIQVKKDTALTLTITLIVILLILIVFYRKILIPLYFIIPVLFGGLFALGMIGFFKHQISGISIATGAVVFGIIIDFSFHFFTHLQHTKSISQTIKEISFPLLTGSFTTIMAFWALLFTNSPILQDFGFFAALSITGAAIFTLTGLPILLKLFRFKSSDFGTKKRELVISIPKKFRKSFALIIVILTGIFLYYSFDIQFDKNIENLSIHSQNLKNKEKELTGFSADIEKKLYLFSVSDTYKKANLLNFNLYQKLKKLQTDHKIKSFFSTSQFIVPDSISRFRFNVWNTFWKKHEKKMFKEFDMVSDSLGFNHQAFVPFKQWISSSPLKKIEHKTIFNTLGINNLINKKDTQTTFITTVVVNKSLLKEVQQKLSKLHGITTFNKSIAATELLAIVQNDFNFILFISTLLVFITLLVVYGRIEIALFSFIPMIISWIWILGIAAIFDIKFNFVNIVIATFIFGLGDDYSIFVTDGLLHKYKYKKDILSSYNIGIILSALTTMVGTGVLFFAKHPAIKSVSVISVLGIFCILIISLVLQPFLFDIFIQKRIEQKKTPITLFAFLISVFEFSWFVFGCLFSYAILLILFVLPLPKNKKRLILNTILSVSSWSVIYSAFHVRKKIFDRTNLDLKKPSIIIANHTSFLDILLLLMLNPKIIIFVKDWVYKSILFGPIVRYAGYIYVGKEPKKNIKIIRERIKEGFSIVVFPEGSRSENDKIRRFHKGAFFIAQELSLDITPILIHGASYTLPKSEFFVKNGYLNLKILPRIKANDLSWGDTFGKRTKLISKYFKEEYQQFKYEQENGKNLFSRVFANYVYKGPILEWYLRIKWKLELKNYEYYNQLLEDKINILDVGCGYGYLSYFLHYKNENRIILGLDYDDEKISIAANGFDKTNQLKFECTDVISYEFKTFDAILLNDVLHYFSKEKQLQLLEKCASDLTKNGIILIRDGITDFPTRHEKTKLTEKFSTQFLAFNKKKEKFHYFSSEDICVFANKHDFSYKMEEHSAKTSNVLFILRKK